jgi:copper chaperone
MISFQVNDMTCGHCISTITKAVKAVDEGAGIEVDLASHRVDIDAPDSHARELGEAIRDAGYTPVPVTAQASLAVRRGGGSCCG